MRAALLQLNVTDDPAANLAATLALFDKAVAGGAGFILTPEMTNCLSSDRAHQRSVYQPEEQDQTLAALRAAAAGAGAGSASSGSYWARNLASTGRPSCWDRVSVSLVP